MGDTTFESDDQPTQFARQFQRFLENLNQLVPDGQEGIRQRLVEHLGQDPSGHPTLVQPFDRSEHPNLQLAMNVVTAEQPDAELVGLPNHLRHHFGFSLTGLLGGEHYGPSGASAAGYVNIPVDLDRTLPCVQLGLYLLRLDGSPIIVLLMTGDEHGPGPALMLEVLATEDGVAARFVERVKALMHELNVYRGKMLAFTFTEYGGFGLTFHRVPVVRRDDVILPAGDLDAIEQHTVGIADRADALRKAGRHLKRGLLLYGPPGTGKTLSVMYLCNRMPDRTTVLLSGPASMALGRAAAIARSLQPAMVVVEDVDLIASERTMPGMGSNPMLFQLLNEMDGLAEDADVIFVLTTNRVELLEAALAARPGRIDQAVEVKLPDAECRRRLLDLYLEGLTSQIDHGAREDLVGRTEGVSAAFIRELVRRATLAAVAAGDPPVVTGELLGSALTDLLEHSAPIVRTMLGAAYDAERDPGPDTGFAGGWAPAPAPFSFDP
jgi:hypothetical protein